MINAASLSVVNNARFSQRFVRPCYDSYCFSNIPPTIEFLLTGKGQSALPLPAFRNLPTRYDKVIFLFVDGFGWRFFERYAEKYPFLKTILAQGIISKMTSQFPSTTAAHVTCIHTGLNVGQSGVYEWHYYEPLLDEIIAPLLFSLARDKSRDTIKQFRPSLPSSSLFPQQTLYNTLANQGVASHILQYYAYTPSTYSDIVFRGATVHPYRSITDGLTLLSSLVKAKVTTPTYYFMYIDRIDTTSHNFGPYSRQTEEVIDRLLTGLDQLFYKEVQGKTGNGGTLLMMSADHGQVDVDPGTTYYLNKQIPGITRLLKTNRLGQPLVPAGSARDMFLYVKDESVDEAIALLQQHLAGRAEIYRTRDLLAQHFFGLQEPSPVLLSRLGNVVILPHKYETVWWYEEGTFSMHFYGHHGGLTSDEMEIPLLVLPL